MHTKNLENSSKIECFMGQNASVRTSMATTVYNTNVYEVRNMRHKKQLLVNPKLSIYTLYAEG